MAKRKSNRPTDAELAILRVLWRLESATVRQVRDELNKVRTTGYTTVLKLMQIMTEKGLVTRDETNRSHVYTPYKSEDQTQRLLVRDLLDRAFGGATHKMVMQALSEKQASPEELAEIRQMLDDHQQGQE
jgi:predicted transcriptional regulator